MPTRVNVESALGMTKKPNWSWETNQMQDPIEVTNLPSVRHIEIPKGVSVVSRKIPETSEERKALHEILLKFAGNAVRNGTTKGLGHLVCNFENPKFRDQLIRWLETYTPIRRETCSMPEHIRFLVPKELRVNYDLGGARLNPYYCMETKNTEKYSKFKVELITYEAAQLSQNEFERKILKRALEKFLIEGSIEARKRLIELVDSYEAFKKNFNARRFVQGGAPGLGRRK